MRYLTFLLFPLAAFPGFSATIDGFVQTNLVSSVSGMAPTTDPSLINPWGMAFTPASPYWASDNGANVSTLYSATGVKQALVVTVPGGPTGIVFNGTSTVFNGDNFIFDTLSGTIEGWRAALGTTPETLFTNPGSVYTGLAIASLGGNSYLYAANFSQNRIDVLGSTGAPSLPGNFTDPNLPAGYAPYGIETIGSQVFVTYAFVDPNTHRAQPGAGQGFVDAFNLDGTLNHRAVTQGALDAPWGLAIAPTGFGSLAGDLLVGNFGDGTINAFDAAGNLIGTLANLNGTPIVNSGLWAIKAGNNGPGSNPSSIYINAGINNETAGVFARIDAVPEPSGAVLLAIGVAFLAARRTLTTRWHA